MPNSISRLGFAAALLGLLAAAGTSFASQPLPEKSNSGSYLAGRTATKLGDNDLASDFFKEALKEDSNNPILIERVFLLELSEGDIPKAEDYAQQVLAFNSQQRMARIVLGLRDFRAGKYDAARHNFAIAGYTPVGELTSALLTAWSYAAQKELTPAIKALDKLDSNENFANFKSFHLALISDHLGNAMRADAAYKTAYENAGTSLRVVQAYGNFLSRNGRFDEAVKVYEAYLQNSEGNPLITVALEQARKKEKPEPMIKSALGGASEGLFSLATSMTDENAIDVGLVYTQLVVSLDGDKPVSYTLLGDIYEDLKRPAKAIDAYSKIPESSPLWNNAALEIAVNLQRLEKQEEAIKHIQDLLKKDPGNFDALVTLGNIYRSTEDFANAGKVYDQAIALIPNPQADNWRVFYYRGICAERTKDWPLAEKNFRQALALAPDEAMVLNYLGYTMIDKRINLNEAMEMIKKAVSLKPNDGYIIDSLGWAYYQLGDYEEAVQHLERAVDLLPYDPIIGEHLGDVYWRVGRKLEAKFQWQHAKDNKPEPEDLKRIEDKLKNGLPEETPVTPVQNGTGQNNG